jgi:ribosomal peptide maturation radical SAM protein 1
LKQIQPGIESFSNQVLKLMNKGCTGLQNIQLLRWCEELQIEPSWNILAGFPGESPDEYQVIARLVPLLTHLAPPCSCGLIRLDRFSPFHSQAEQFGFERVRPARAYYYVFPLGRQALGRLAYFFDFDYADQRDPNTYIMPVQQAVQTWITLRHQTERKAPRLDATFENGSVTIDDTRPIAVATKHELTGVASSIIARCDVAASCNVLAESLEISEEEVHCALAELRNRRLIAESDGMVVSLPVFRNRPLSSALESHAKTHVPISETLIAKPLLPVV